MKAFCRALLLFMLIVLPFIRFPESLADVQGGKVILEAGLVQRLLKLSEDLCITILPVLLITAKSIKPKAISFDWNPYIKWLFILIAVGIISAVLNNIKPLQFMIGTYFILKIYVLFFLGLSLSYNLNDMQKIVHIIIYIAMILAIIGIIGEILALTLQMGINILVADRQRFGLYRITSLSGPGSWNLLGLYYTFALFLLIEFYKKSLKKYLMIIILVIGIILSFSRQTWMILLLMTLLLFRGMRFYIAILIIFSGLIGLIFTAEIYDTFYNTLTVGMVADPERYLRLFGYFETARILLEDPIFGCGPGNFGSVAAIMFDSPIVKKWPSLIREQFENAGGFDSYWPWVAGEFGLAGFLCLGLCFYFIYTYLDKAVKFFRANDNFEMYRLGQILKYFLIVGIFIKGALSRFVGGYMMFTYFTLAGIYLSLTKAEIKRTTINN